MKKITLSFITILCIALSGVMTSCSDDDDDTFALLGAWQCTEISGNAGGLDLSQYLSTSSTEYGKYTKLFTIYFVGGTSGKYFRIGDESTFQTSAETISGLFTSDASEEEKTSLSKFLSSGTYSTSGSTLTLTSKDGETETYTYSISNGVLKLTSSTNITDNDKVNSATTVLNSILNAVGAKEDINTTVGITYTYEKKGLDWLINYLKPSTSE